MSSSQTGEPRRGTSRVIKSGTDVGARFAFPALEQVTPRDLPPSRSEALPVEAPVREPERPRVTPAPVTAVYSEAAAEAEARAKAMERRAAHVLEEAEDAAERRLAVAEEQAQTLLQEATAEAEMIRAGARQAGLEEGRAEGYAFGMSAAQTEAEQLMAVAQAETDALLAEARSAALSIQEGALAERVTLLAASQEQVLDLAFAVARQVLRAELTLNPAAVVPMLEAALAKLKGDEEPQIRVSPEVAQLLEEYRGRLLAAIPGARRLTVEGDPALEAGDFLVQGAQGYIDGRLEQQVAVLETEAKEEER